MEPIKVDVNNLSAEQKKIDRIVRAHDEEVAQMPLNVFEVRGNGTYFLIYERTPQFHDWFNVVHTTEGNKVSITIQKVPHMG